MFSRLPAHSLIIAAALLAVRAQDTSSSSSSSSSSSASSSSSSSASPSASGSAPPSASSSAPSAPPTVPVTLTSTNPTAVPLTAIVPGTPSTTVTIPLSTVHAAGATPSVIPGPGLPDISGLNPALYPPLDRPPPTDTPEVREWVEQVRNSGIEIPDTPPLNPGGCPNNTQAAANAGPQGSCWWTCGHCTRPTDIVSCADRLTWGVSFDDGPSPYTPNLLQYLDDIDVKSTFFVVGGRALSRPDILRDQYMGGHQISVHTWSHWDMVTQTTETIIAELGWTMKVIKDVLGVTPNTFRPPFGSLDDRVRAIAKAMGLTPIIWTRANNFTFDTNDFNINGGTVSPSQVLVNFQTILGAAAGLDSGFIVLEHDLFPQTVELATGYVLPMALANNPKLTLKPIIECVNKRLADSYKETNNNSSNPPPETTPPDQGNNQSGADASGGIGWQATLLSLLAAAGGTALGL